MLSLPQDIQSHAYDWPAGFFAGRDWVIRRPQPDREEVAAVLALLAAAARPLIIAGGGVIYSGAEAELERLAGTAGIPVAETFAGKGAVQQRAWWQIGGIGLEGTPAANALAREADLVLTVGARLTDFATASHSLFADPAVRFASINVNPRDAPARCRRHHRRREAGAGRAGRRRGPGGPARARGLAGPRRASRRRVGRGPGRRARPGPGVRPGAGRPGRGHYHGRGADPGAGHRGPGRARAAGRRGDRRGRGAARRPAQGVGRDRRPPLPPGVRVLLHGV